MACDFYCSVSLPHGAVGWSAVCDCGILWSYSPTFSICFGGSIPSLLQTAYAPAGIVLVVYSRCLQCVIVQFSGHTNLILHVLLWFLTLSIID